MSPERKNAFDSSPQLLVLGSWDGYMEGSFPMAQWERDGLKATSSFACTVHSVITPY